MIFPFSSHSEEFSTSFRQNKSPLIENAKLNLEHADTLKIDTVSVPATVPPLNRSSTVKKHAPSYFFFSRFASTRLSAVAASGH